MSSEEIYQGIKEFADYTDDIEETCDVVVVGSGPTGAVSAYNLAEAGLNTVLVEAGPIRRPKDFTLDGARTLTEVCYEGGTRVLAGRVMIPTMQARVLGGGSHINSAICVRTPQFCFDDWRKLYDVDTIDREVLDPHYDRVEQFLGVRPTEEDALGKRNLLFKKACDAMGFSSEPTPRNVVGCAGCAECYTGCPKRAKKSMDVSYIPEAVKKGLRVYTSVQVMRLLHAGGVALGLLGRVTTPEGRDTGKRVLIRAKAVVFASGCLATPVILQKSEAPDPAKLIGKNLQAHPGVAVMGVFEEEVNPWEGATQGYQSLDYLEEGFKLEVLWAPPPLMSVRFPDFGLRFKEHLASLRYGAPWDAFFAFKHSSGSVSARRGKSMNPNAKYHLSPKDMPIVKRGLETLAEMFFAAGAVKILPGVMGMSDVMTDRKQIAEIRDSNLTPQQVVTAATHVFSTTRMGPDPKNSVVREDGEMHHLKNCYIVDTGIMPKSPAVNPMLTGMALADKISLGIAEKYK